MSKTTVCTTCGSKIAATRERCPKCRAIVVRVDAAAEAVRNRKRARAAGIILAVFVLGVAGLWLTRDAPAERNVTARPAADPLATRRPTPPVDSSEPAAQAAQAESQR